MRTSLADGAGANLAALVAEVLYVAAFYAATSIRNRFGSETVSPETAYENARLMIDIEKEPHLYFEEALQDLFPGNPAFMRFWNIFYGFFHFAVTGFTAIWLYIRDPESYPKWRNVLACTTALALNRLRLFPPTPPRLLDSCGQFGMFCPNTHFGYWTRWQALRRPVVVRLGDHQGGVQPVRRHAEPAFRLVVLVLPRPLPACRTASARS